MDSDLTQRLQRLQQRAAELGQLASELASAAPERSEGYDASGRVSVVLGRDGLPTDIQVRDRWQDRMEPEQLGQAVLDATHDAGQAATQAFTGSLDERRWWRRRQEADAGPQEGPFRSNGPVPRSPVGRRQLDGEFNEKIMRTLRATASQANEPSPVVEVEGTDDGHHVMLTLNSGGLSECFIEPDWARNRTASLITDGLLTALRRARRKLPPSDGVKADLDALIGDALATLNAFARQPTSGDS
ncbi:YbaB/EbfC family nucleoid-associated protein [Actinoplanes hulinensis]|uniref:YbaB/EbfC family nucleoid-associated protein n=1 Tax=Actinoplanes hulinensis TaxID=1144547 RepID=A0ABS7BAX0_9ACTN|nr:YbaB/EbfC family nucleoid-associated protein [Actinoplanes hulinensis]MBW6438209.1 YbaB/EbfC family nucleoid-associated protein [Actinoplanes hulinensis]